MKFHYIPLNPNVKFLLGLHRLKPHQPGLRAARGASTGFGRSGSGERGSQSWDRHLSGAEIAKKYPEIYVKYMDTQYIYRYLYIV